jgi:hypothetical protein
MRKLLLNMLFLVVLVSCGMPTQEETTKTETFSMKSLSNAGLYMGEHRFTSDSQSSFVIVCDDKQQEKASQRIQLLKDLKGWSSNSIGDLVLDGDVSVSEGEVHTVANQAIGAFSQLDPDDMNCPSYWLASTYMY